MWLYAIIGTEYIKERSLKQIVESLIQGGVNFIQLREKNASTKDFIDNALIIKKLTKKTDIPLIINDRVDIALAVDAQGVHLGQDDMPIQYARKILGNKKIIGISVSSKQEAIIAEEQSANYIAVSSPFQSATKSKKNIPVSEIKEIKESVKIPVLVIGGINLENLDTILSIGIDGVCMSKSLIDVKNIKETTQKFRKKLNKCIKQNTTKH